MPVQKLDLLKKNVQKVFLGNQAAVDKIIVCLLARGHVLIEDVPGVGKTILATALSKSLDCTISRVQMTPDLLPGDILGVTIWNQQKGDFIFKPGPIFSNVLLADEINRTTPRTQSALLEAMNESQVSIDGQTRKLIQPFMVIATQNPFEFEGTYFLPESQLDRFLMQIDILYPELEAERRILLETTGADQAVAQTAMSAEELAEYQQLVRRMPVGESVVNAILQLVRAARPPEGETSGNDITNLIAWGPGPRASQALMLTVRARALVEGRLAPSVDDVLALAEPILQHRMALTFAARALTTRQRSPTLASSFVSFGPSSSQSTNSNSPVKTESCTSSTTIKPPSQRRQTALNKRARPRTRIAGCLQVRHCCNRWTQLLCPTVGVPISYYALRRALLVASCASF